MKPRDYICSQMERLRTAPLNIQVIDFNGNRTNHMSITADNVEDFCAELQYLFTHHQLRSPDDLTLTED